MKPIAQKRISGFFNTKPKKHIKIIKYCISEVTNETEDKDDEVICLSGSKESEKQVKKTVGRRKTRKKQSRLWKYCTTFTIYMKWLSVKNFMNVLMLKNFMQIVQSVKQERDFLCARNWKFVRTIQHIKNKGKMQEFLFGLQDSTVRKICKAAPPKNTNKGRFGDLKGIDRQILVWVLEMMDLHFPISSLALSKFAKSNV